MTMPQYVVVYGPPDEPIVYTTVPPDTELASIAAWEAEQRLGEPVRITAGDAVPVPVKPR